jgi:uncharacterized protein YndB with AHSA1/START domain
LKSLLKQLFSSISATGDEVAVERGGDDIVEAADAVMDRAFTLDASPQQVWPWLVQLGKQRAGWYLPRSVERFVPPARRALRSIDPRWQSLDVGDVIPDYGGRHETFEVTRIDPPHTLVYTSYRGRMRVSWSLTLTTAGLAAERTRLHLRLRLGPVRRKWLVNTAGELLDAATVAGLAAGLRERVADRS